MIIRSLTILNQLKKLQYLSVEELQRLQFDKFKALLKHAYHNVKYYRNLLTDSRIVPEDIDTIDDIRKFPITKKEKLQELSLDERASKGVDLRKCVVKYTSGSTGTPLKFFFSKQERDFQSLLNLRIFQACGFKLTDKTAYLINPHRFPKGKYWFQNFGILRRYYFSVFDTAEVHARALENLEPDILYGYPSNLTLLALLMQKKGINSFRPKAVFSSAEALAQRPKKLIAAAMNSDVYDILGLVETGDIAWECPAHEGYHINSDAVLMEFLDEEDNPVKPGQPGRLVCTNLYGYTMPLIRYEVGDICVPSDRMCSCGRNLPLMESIKGRANDFIVLSDGKIIASCFLVIIMQSFTDVSQYRMIQEERGGLTVQIVKGKGFNEGISQKIKEEIGRISGGSLNVTIETADELERDESGKIRTVVSKAIPDFVNRLPLDNLSARDRLLSEKI